MKSGRPSHPRYLNLRGGLPTWTPPTFAVVNAIADAARAAGFEATVTADCRAIVHGVCQPFRGRCHRSDIQLRDAGSIERLAQQRDTCAEHAVAVA